MNLMLLVAIAIATPPPGYVKPPNEDKDPPRYRYTYEIGNDDGNEGQGKTETRSGDFASGRYYVNGEKSSTDVRYYADLWGYHPLVKYRAASDHSSATAHFALGEHAVKSLLNGSEIGEEVKLPPLKGRQAQPNRRPSRRRRPVQLVQPNTPASSEITSSSIGGPSSIEKQPIDDTSDVNSLHNYDHQGASARTTGFHDGLSSTFSYQQNFNNYVTVPRTSSESIGQAERLASNDRDYSGRPAHPESNAGTTPVPEHHASTRTNTQPRHSSTSVSSSANNVRFHTEQRASSHEDSNDLFSTISDDVLRVENAGSFGRRLKPTLYSSTERTSLEPKTQQKFTSGTYQSVYESSTSKPISGISKTPDKVVNDDALPYASYSTSPTTPPTTRVTYSTLIPYDSEQPIVVPTPDYHDFRNSIGAEGSSNDDKNTINDARQRDSTVSGNYAAIFAKIYPNGERNHKIVEGVNSLVAADSGSTRHESHEKHAGSNGVDEIEGTTRSSDYAEKLDHQLYVTLRQSLDKGLRDSLNVRSSTPVPPSAYSSKPIIVAELSDHKFGKTTEYSTTFPCNNDKSSTVGPGLSSIFQSSCAEQSDTLLVTPNLQTSQSHITTSSVILNPIQAGVSLVNADQTELIGAENQRGGSPAPVNENIEADGEAVAIKTFPTGRGNELGKIVTEEARSKFYETINPAFGQSTLSTGRFDKTIEMTGPERDPPSDRALPAINAADQRIEIQKSVEIYQNAPVHEIHYPPQVITQVFGIDHRHGQEVKQQPVNIAEHLHQRNETNEAEKMRRTYGESQDFENAKEFHSSRQIYNAEAQMSHDKPTYLSLESIRNASLVRESAYPGNAAHRDNELADDPMYRNNGLPPSLSGQGDGSRMFKSIKDSVPEIKYTAAKTPRISVKVYPTIVETNDDRQLNKWQRESLQAQREQIKSNGAEPIKKVQSQLQKILSESESVQRNFDDAKPAKLQGLEQRQQQQQPEVIGSQEARETYQYQERKQRLQQASGNFQVQKQHQHDQQSGGSYQVQENIDESKVRQSQQLQSIVVPWSQLYDAPSVKNLHGNSGNMLEDISTTAQPLLQNHPGTPMSERIVEKTIHVPQPYPVEVPRIIEKKVPYAVEKIVERKVPYPVEKIIEKKIPVPQPYPVHIQVPVDRVVEKQVQILQPYPVHVEKIIEKKVPYAVQRLVPQPYPVHILQPYPVEKIIEKPVHIPITVEKIIEKKVHVPQPYPVQVPIKVPYPVEITKYVENTVQVPYGVRYGVSYQQIMKPQSSKGLYSTQSSVAVPLYGVSLVSNHNRDRERPNVSQDFQGYSYDKPALPFVSGQVDSADADQQVSNGWEQFSHGKSSSNPDNNNHRHQTFAKKSHHAYSSKLPSLAYPLRNYSGTNRRHASYRQATGPVSEQSVTKDEYVGPVPSLKHNVQHQITRSRSSTHQQQQQLLLKHTTAVTRPPPSATMPTSSRRARQQDIPSQYKTGSGTFRQSKIEYGFKPPMVPSVQYDEKTATKVEN